MSYSQAQFKAHQAAKFADALNAMSAAERRIAARKLYQNELNRLHAMAASGKWELEAIRSRIAEIERLIKEA